MSMQTFKINDNTKIDLGIFQEHDIDYLINDILEDERYTIYNTGGYCLGTEIGHLNNLLTKLLGDHTVLEFIKHFNSSDIISDIVDNSYFYIDMNLNGLSEEENEENYKNALTEYSMLGSRELVADYSDIYLEEFNYLKLEDIDVEDLIYNYVFDDEDIAKVEELTNKKIIITEYRGYSQGEYMEYFIVFDNIEENKELIEDIDGLTNYINSLLRGDVVDIYYTIYNLIKAKEVNGERIFNIWDEVDSEGLGSIVVIDYEEDIKDALKDFNNEHINKIIDDIDIYNITY